jgi:hypothetical protein
MTLEIYPPFGGLCTSHKVWEESHTSSSSTSLF